MNTNIADEQVSLVLPESAKKYSFSFAIPKDKFMNSNATGYARTASQQRFANFNRIKQRQFLVDLGKQAAQDFGQAPLTNVLVICSVSNPTNHRFDPPNAELTEKHIMDGLVQGGLLEDDNRSIVKGTLFQYLNKKQKDVYLMTIDIYDLQ